MTMRFLIINFFLLINGENEACIQTWLKFEVSSSI